MQTAPPPALELALDAVRQSAAPLRLYQSRHPSPVTKSVILETLALADCILSNTPEGITWMRAGVIYHCSLG